MSRLLSAAASLHRYLVATHWNGRALMGPDPGIRFTYRIGRFIKGYLSAIPWKDDLYYLQGQGYWVLGNWRMHGLTGKAEYRDYALLASESMLERQREDGAWEYPNWEWKGRIATAEGSWGALGLLESYRQTREPRFLEGALRWHRFLNGAIGYQRAGKEWAVNYFAHRQGARVPNNSAFVLRFLAELADLTGDVSYLRPCNGMVAFLDGVQRPSGELPYNVPGEGSPSGRPHFQCYQYNAFQCLDLLRYYEVAGDAAALRLAMRVLDFLRAGQTLDGHSPYDCGNPGRAVVYHAAVMGAAFVRASQHCLDGYAQPASKAFDYVLAQQRPDGGFPHSRGDYRVLSDRRSYPRYLAMILYHLLSPYAAAEVEHARTEVAREGVR